MAFTPRLTDAGMLDNPYWYSANPFYISGYGLPNCTTYAWGRFWECSDPNHDYSNRPNLCLLDAKYWWAYTQDGYQRGNFPQLGAIICYDYGTFGHVAVVEIIHDDNSITISNSATSGNYFFTQRVYRSANGKYNNGGGDNQGFIYNPFVTPTPPPQQRRSQHKFPFAVAWRHWGNYQR